MHGLKSRRSEEIKAESEGYKGGEEKGSNVMLEQGSASLHLSLLVGSSTNSFRNHTDGTSFSTSHSINSCYVRITPTSDIVEIS